MARNNKKGPKKPCPEELIALQGVPPGTITETKKSKKEKLAEKKKLAEMEEVSLKKKLAEKTKATDKAKSSDNSEATSSDVSTKAKKGSAVEKENVEEKVYDSDGSEATDVTEITWIFDSDSEMEEIITAKNKVKQNKFTEKSKTKGAKATKEEKLANQSKIKYGKSTKDDKSTGWTTVNKKVDTYKDAKKKEANKEMTQEDKAKLEEKREEDDDMTAKKEAKKARNKISKAKKKAKRQAEEDEKDRCQQEEVDRIEKRWADDKAEAIKEAKAAKKMLSGDDTTSDPTNPSVQFSVFENGDTSESEPDFEPDMFTSSLKPLCRSNKAELWKLQTRCMSCDSTNVMISDLIEELETKRKPLQASLSMFEDWIATNLGDNHVTKTLKMMDGPHGRKYKAGAYERYIGKEAAPSAQRQWFQDKIRPIDELIATYKLEMKTGVLKCKLRRYERYVHGYGCQILTLDGRELTPESEVPSKDKTVHEHVTVLFKEVQKFRAQIAVLEAKAKVKAKGSAPEDEEGNCESGPRPCGHLVSGRLMKVYIALLTMWFLASVFLWLTS